MTTRNEIKQLLMIFQAAYPNFHPVDKTVTVNLWHSMLKDYDFGDLTIAAQAYIATDTSGFAPSIGQLIDRLQELKAPQFPDEGMAWTMYRKALSRASHSQEEFDKLPEIVQKTIGSAENIYYTGMSQTFNEDVVRSNFLTSYRITCARERKNAALPAAARALIEAATPRLEERA